MDSTTAVLIFFVVIVNIIIIAVARRIFKKDDTKPSVGKSHTESLDLPPVRRVETSSTVPPRLVVDSTPRKREYTPPEKGATGTIIGGGLTVGEEKKPDKWNIKKAPSNDVKKIIIYSGNDSIWRCPDCETENAYNVRTCTVCYYKA